MSIKTKMNNYINNDNLTPLDDSSDINTNILRKDLVNDSEFLFVRIPKLKI
jgi:CRISPR/Cas system-associated protein Cas7 (RAMP superfamily)